MKRIFETTIVIAVATFSARAADNAAGVEFFEKKIRPVLAENCYKCHSAQAAQYILNALHTPRAAVAA